jgi:hypothetical protein
VWSPHGGWSETHVYGIGEKRQRGSREKKSDGLNVEKVNEFNSLRSVKRRIYDSIVNESEVVKRQV